MAGAHGARHKDLSRSRVHHGPRGRRRGRGRRCGPAGADDGAGPRAAVLLRGREESGDMRRECADHAKDAQKMNKRGPVNSTKRTRTGRGPCPTKPGKDRNHAVLGSKTPTRTASVRCDTDHIYIYIFSPYKDPGIPPHFGWSNGGEYVRNQVEWSHWGHGKDI